MKIANAECVQSKTYRVLTPVLPVTKKFDQNTVQQCLKAMHGNLSNFQLFITEVIEHFTRLVLTYTTKTSEKNRPGPRSTVIVMSPLPAPHHQKNKQLTFMRVSLQRDTRTKKPPIFLVRSESLYF